MISGGCFPFPCSGGCLGVALVNFQHERFTDRSDNVSVCTLVVGAVL